MEIKILSVFWHSVDPDSLDPEYIDGSNPSASQFRKHVEYIVKNYTPISIVDFMRIIENRRLLHSYSKPPILMGFDDGFQNVIGYALPILREFHTPALFFVIGEILKNPDFIPWYLEIKHLLRKTKKKTICYENVVIEMGSKKGRELCNSLFSRSYKSCRREEERVGLLTKLANLLNVERPTRSIDLDDDLRLVSLEDLNNLGNGSLLTIGSHAMTHRNLACLTYEEQFYELEQSHLLLRGHCPSYYPVVAYPDGSFSDHTIAVTKRIYKTGFAVVHGSSFNNFYAYPRICMGYETSLEYVLSSFRLNYIVPLKRFLVHLGFKMG